MTKTDDVIVAVVVDVNVDAVSCSVCASSAGVDIMEANGRDASSSSEIAVDATSGIVLVLCGDSTYRVWVLYVDSR